MIVLVTVADIPLSSVTVSVTVRVPAVAYTREPETVPTPLTSVTIPSDVVPSPQFQTAVWVSRNPGSLNAALRLTGAPTCGAGDGLPMGAGPPARRYPPRPRKDLVTVTPFTSVSVTDAAKFPLSP